MVPRRTGIAVCLAVLMLVSAIAAGTAAGAPAPALDEIDEDDVDPADEIVIVDENEIALVYEEDSDDDLHHTEFGVDVATGLTHLLVEAEGDDDVSGAFSATLRPDHLSGDGELAIEQPDEVTDLSANFEATQTDTANRFDGELDAVIDVGGPAPFESGDTSGEITVDYDEFQASGEYELAFATDQHAPEERFDVVIDETATGYTVDVEEIRQIHTVAPGSGTGSQLSTSEQSEPDPNWETEQAARETLQNQYEGIASEFGGTASVTVHEHSYEERTDAPDRLDIAYAIELSGVQQGVAETLAQEIAADPEVDLTPEEQDALADAILELDVEEIAFETVESAAGTSGSATVHMANYQAVSLEFVDVLGQQDDVPFDEEALDEFEETLDAQETAELSQQLSWSGTLAQAGTEVQVSFTTAYEAENWGEYVSELEDRGMHDVAGDVTFVATADGDGDDIDLTVEFDVDHDSLVDDAVEAFRTAAQDDPDVDEEAVEFLQAFEEAGFEVAKMDADLQHEAVTVRAGAQFEDLNALAEFAEEQGDLPISHVYGEGDSDVTTTYVYLQDVSTDEEELRATPLADQNTDFRDDVEELPRLEVEEVADYLGVEMDTEAEQEDVDDAMPGFGVAGALLALFVSAVAIAHRRR